LAQESGPENLEAKKKLFAEMDELAKPNAILASSTSFIEASRFSKKLKGRHRCLVGHPVNPPHLVPIVEIAPAEWTDAESVEKARKIYEKAGQVPIILRKESPGFILNRLQAVLLAEAARASRNFVVSWLRRKPARVEGPIGPRASRALIALITLWSLWSLRSSITF
jgi:3-hydroxyacyl-CoA dehydrogenase